jgi:hypothetical protein
MVLEHEQQLMMTTPEIDFLRTSQCERDPKTATSSCELLDQP